MNEANLSYQGQIKNGLPCGIGRIESGAVIAEGYFQSRDKGENLLNGVLRLVMRVGFDLCNSFYLPDAKVIH